MGQGNAAPSAKREGAPIAALMRDTAGACPWQSGAPDRSRRYSCGDNRRQYGYGKGAGPMFTVETQSVEETRAFGERLAGQLRPGDVVLLEGDLGAGKSELTRGIARGLGITGPVTSPTFTILQVHEGGRLPLFHFDWYRLSGADELYELSMDEYLYDRGVSVVEWPSMAQDAVPETHLRIRIDAPADNERRFLLEPAGTFHALDERALEATR